MKVNSKCKYCGVVDEDVVEWKVWRGKTLIEFFYAHRDCHIKECSTSGDGAGKRHIA